MRYYDYTEHDMNGDSINVDVHIEDVIKELAKKFDKDENEIKDFLNITESQKYTNISLYGSSYDTIDISDEVEDAIENYSDNKISDLTMELNKYKKYNLITFESIDILEKWFYVYGGRKFLNSDNQDLKYITEKIEKILKGNL